jgi:hypothetical protein
MAQRRPETKTAHISPLSISLISRRNSPLERITAWLMHFQLVNRIDNQIRRRPLANRRANQPHWIITTPYSRLLSPNKSSV